MRPNTGTDKRNKVITTLQVILKFYHGEDGFFWQQQSLSETTKMICASDCIFLETPHDSAKKQATLIALLNHLQQSIPLLKTPYYLNEVKKTPGFEQGPAQNVLLYPMCYGKELIGTFVLINCQDYHYYNTLVDVSPYVNECLPFFVTNTHPAIKETQQTTTFFAQQPDVAESLAKNAFHPIILFNDALKVLFANQAAYRCFNVNLELGWRTMDKIFKEHLPDIHDECIAEIDNYSFSFNLTKARWEDTYIHKNEFVQTETDVRLFRTEYQTQPCFGLMLSDVEHVGAKRAGAHESLVRFHAITKMLPVAVLQIDSQRNCHYFNRRWLEMSCLERHESKDKGWLICFESNILDDLFLKVLQIDHYDKQWHKVVKLTNKYGKSVWVEFHAIGVFTESYQLTDFIVAINDISTLKNNEEKLLYLATTDPLTKVGNRAVFDERLKQLCQRREHHTLSALLMIDLDDFKIINDTHGHSLGDALLVNIAAKLKAMVRAHDVVARFGGDEFAVIINDVNSEQNLTHIAFKLLETLAEPITINAITLNPCGSIGIAAIYNDDLSADELLRRADIALYQAKDAGKSQVYFYNSDKDEYRTALPTVPNTNLRAEGFCLRFFPTSNLFNGANNGSKDDIHIFCFHDINSQLQRFDNIHTLIAAQQLLNDVATIFCIRLKAAFECIFTRKDNFKSTPQGFRLHLPPALLTSTSVLEALDWLSQNLQQRNVWMNICFDIQAYNDNYQEWQDALSTLEAAKITLNLTSCDPFFYAIDNLLFPVINSVTLDGDALRKQHTSEAQRAFIESWITLLKSHHKHVDVRFENCTETDIQRSQMLGCRSGYQLETYDGLTAEELILSNN